MSVEINPIAYSPMSRSAPSTGSRTLGKIEFEVIEVQTENYLGEVDIVRVEGVYRRS